MYKHKHSEQNIRWRKQNFFEFVSSLDAWYSEDKLEYSHVFPALFGCRACFVQDHLAPSTQTENPRHFAPDFTLTGNALESGTAIPKSFIRSSPTSKNLSSLKWQCGPISQTSSSDSQVSHFKCKVWIKLSKLLCLFFKCYIIYFSVIISFCF